MLVSKIWVIILFILKILFIGLCCSSLLSLIISLEMLSCSILFCFCFCLKELMPSHLIMLVMFAAESAMGLSLVVGTARNIAQSGLFV